MFDMNYKFKSGKFEGYSITEVLNVSPEYVYNLIIHDIIKVNRKVRQRTYEKMNVKENKFIE